jgi:hypothetical protein
MDIQTAIVRHYQAPLRMLRQAIEACPEALWLEGEPNRFWHLAYHALFYTHFYLSVSDADFVPWPKHRAETNFLSAPPSQPEVKPETGVPYSKAELLEYADFCLNEVGQRVPALDLAAPSGFYWLPFDKLELQLYSIRHLAHHTGQLIDRLRTECGIGIGWVR